MLKRSRSFENGWRRTIDSIRLIALPLAAAVLLLVGRFLFNADGFSPVPRGDVAIDAAVAASLAEGKGFWTPWERGTRYLPPTGDEHGFPADQHPPLWPVAGALLMRLLDCSPLRALEWASFLSHVAVLVLMVLLARKLGMGRWAFAPALAWSVMGVGCAFSFNGSLYSAQAALYLAAAWLMSGQEIRPGRAFLLGLVMAAAYLLNYQALLLVPAFLLKQALSFRRASVLPTALALLAFAGVASPWLIRNASVFQNPFYSVNTYYLLAKAGATFSHEVVDGFLVLKTEPLGAAALVKGLAVCAWQNIPFLLMLVMGIFPGCAAAWAAGKRDSLINTMGIVLLLHLAACLLWPACKVRYLVPAGPLLLLPAWKMMLDINEVSKRRIMIVTAALGLLCAAVWIKGSVHGEGLCIAFLLGYFSLSLILLLRSSVLPALAMVLLALSTAGTWPGEAYFNIAPWPDFTGEDKEAVEAVRAEDIAGAAAFMEREGIDRIIADLALWHLLPGCTLVTPPKVLPGEDDPGNIGRTASGYGIRHALLPLDRGTSPPVWQGRVIKIIKIDS